MISKYFPHEYVNSAYNINYQKLFDLGYRGIIFDIDNTLVHHGEDADEKVEALFEKLKSLGFLTLLLSDNDEERVLRFNKNIKSDYIYDANKPSPKSFNEAVKKLGLSKDKAVVIGDRMFKDILGANNADIPSIMVRFIDNGDKWLGWGRYLEFVLLFLWRHSKYYKRMGGISMTEKESVITNFKKFLKHEILFCDISPACYKVSNQKEVLKRHIHNATHKENFLKTRDEKPLPILVYTNSSNLIKKGKGIDPATQYAKAKNIEIACSKINGAIIKPGEVFSFWKMVGSINEKKGYQKGRILEHGSLVTGFGGGLCNLGNTLHLLALHSPLDVTEAHYHSDALAPDHGERIPMSSGTSVSYNNLDLRFRNNTDQNFQIITWVADEKLFAELRCEHEFPCEYSITEDDHRFVLKDGKYYRKSKIYRNAKDKKTGKVTRTLIRDNNSEVMFSYDQIPQDLIKEN
jgi:vancomycin resistance protein VanW